jgi:peptidylprolyl isomerase
MRRLLPLLIGTVALVLVVACGGGSNASKTATPTAVTPTGTAPAAATPTGQQTQQAVTTATSFADACKKTGEKQWSSAPPRIIDTSKTYIATIKTAKGNIVLQLFSDVPVTTNNFVFLACKGFYDGVTFHRVIPSFVAQGGDPTGSGSGGPGYTIPDESSNGHKMDAGVISFAKNSDPTTGQTIPHSAGSQFFITYAPQPSLEAGFTVFGKVTSGMDVALSLTPRDPSTNPNAPPGDAITTITIAEQ